MKNIKILLVTFFAITNLSLVNAQNKKVAVVTFYGDKQIGVSELGGNAEALKFISNIAEDPSFNIEAMLTKFHDSFFTNYAEDLPFDLVEEKDVLTNEAYQNFEIETNVLAAQEGNYYIFPDYKFIPINGSKKNLEGIFEALNNEYDGVMLVGIYFDFKPKIAFGGNGTAGVRAYASIYLYNKELKKVLSINETAVSNKTVGLVKGIPTAKAAKIIPLCENALEELMEDLNKKIGKLTKKVDKKL
jgi:hypothetical protein